MMPFNFKMLVQPNIFEVNSNIKANKKVCHKNVNCLCTITAPKKNHLIPVTYGHEMKTHMYRTSGLIRIDASIGAASTGPPGSKEVSSKHAQIGPPLVGCCASGPLKELTTCMEDKHKHCCTYFSAIKAIKAPKGSFEPTFLFIFMSHGSVRMAIPLLYQMTWR